MKRPSNLVREFLIGGIILLITYVLIAFQVTYYAQRSSQRYELEELAQMCRYHSLPLAYLGEKAIKNIEESKNQLLELRSAGQPLEAEMFRENLTLNQEFNNVWLALESDYFIVDPDFHFDEGVNAIVYSNSEGVDQTTIRLLEDSDIYNAIKSEQKTSIFNFSPDKTKGKVCIAGPVMDGDKFLGAFGITIKNELLKQQLVQLAPRYVKDILVMTVGGDEVFRINQQNLSIEIDRNMINQKSLDQGYFISQNENMGELTHFVTPITLNIENSPWYIILTIPSKSIGAHFLSFRNLIIGVMVAGGLLLMVLYLYSVNRISRESKQKDQVKSQLRESEAQFSSFIESRADVNYYSIDRDYKYIHFNHFHKKETRKNFGSKPTIGANHLDILPEDIKENLSKLYAKAFSGHHFTHLMRYKDKYYSYVFNPIHSESGEVISSTISVFDLSKQVLARKKLDDYREHLEVKVEEKTKEVDEQYHFFQEIIDNDPNSIFIRDAEGIYTLVNRSFANLNNKEISDIVGKQAAEFHDDVLWDEYAGEDELVLSEGQSFTDIKDFPRNSNDKWLYRIKKRIWIREQPYVLGVLSDITDLKKAELKTQKANAELHRAFKELHGTQLKLVESEKLASIGQLAAGIAHEINNPINYVAGAVEPLRADLDEIKSLYRDIRESIEGSSGQLAERMGEILDHTEFESLEQEIDQLLDGILSGSSRVKGLMTNLKNFTRQEDGIKISYDVNEAIKSTISLMQYSFKDRIKLHEKYEKLPEIICNPGQLSQVFLNILENATHAIKGNGEIFVETGTEKNTIWITVRDTGIGIPELIIKKVFDPFFTTKEVGEGTGLGLSISLNIIKEHKGRMFVESIPGEGATFHIKLPAKV